MDISLALGGGGAKGNAHLGVIRRLEREGFRIRAVAGTSFGGVVAALYAFGKTPDEIENLFAGVDQSRLFGHLPGDGPVGARSAGGGGGLDRSLGGADAPAQAASPLPDPADPEGADHPLAAGPGPEYFLTGGGYR